MSRLTALAKEAFARFSALAEVACVFLLVLFVWIFCAAVVAIPIAAWLYW